MNVILFFIGYIFFVLAMCFIIWPWPKNTYKPNPNLLRDAVADAKAVRQTALLKAKEYAARP